MLIGFLLVVTFASLAVSAGLLTYVLRLTREERDRSEARAAALEQALGTSSRETIESPDAIVRPDPEQAATAQPLERWSPSQTFAAEAAKHDLTYQDDVEEGRMPSPSFFGTHDTNDVRSADDEGPRVSRAVLVPAVGVLVVALIGGLGAGVVWTRNHLAASTPAQGPTGAPLELVSLKHERVGDGLHISGIVRNPQDGRVVKGLAAVAFLFDRDGNYVSSDRAPLDYVQLLPGEESPFSIAVPSAAGVSRYRVTFRTDAGIIAHVDRRSDPPVVPAASR